MPHAAKGRAGSGCLLLSSGQPFASLHVQNVNPPPQFTRTDYAINAGNQPIGWSCEKESNLGPFTFAEGDDPKYNWDPYGEIVKMNGVSYQRSQIKLADITKGGSSRTYLVGEKYVNPFDYDTGADPCDNEGVYIGFSNDVTRMAYYAPMQDVPGYTLWCTPFGSAHAFTFQMAMCDGSRRRSTTRSSSTSTSTWPTAPIANRFPPGRTEAP